MYLTKAFVEEVRLKNFRCFEDEVVSLARPDGARGSGLTVLVGNNGCGKTSVLDGLDLALGGKYRAENRIGMKDFRSYDKPIEVLVTTPRFSISSDLLHFRGKYFNSLGADLSAKSRERKQAGRFLSSPIEVSAKFRLDEDTYYNEKDDSVHETKEGPRRVDPRELQYDAGRAGADGLNIFYFDRNRARHLSSGTYRTTFDAICDDLNWKFIKKLKESGADADYARKVSEDLFEMALDLAQKGTGSRLAQEFSEFFGDPSLGSLRFDLLSPLEPFSGAMLAVRENDQLTQVNTRGLGSGVELVLAILLQRLLSNEAKGQKLFLIDEPEMHLHPTAQMKLADLLLNEAAESQVVLSTHSPYLLKCLLGEANAVVFRRDPGPAISVENPSGEATGLFKWSPSFGDVNYRAFDMPTVEFHNELYGALQASLSATSQVDSHLASQGVPVDRKWFNEKSGRTEDVSLCTYVRHSIHHPENEKNPRYTDSELGESTKILTRLMRSAPL